MGERENGYGRSKSRGGRALCLVRMQLLLDRVFDKNH